MHRCMNWSVSEAYKEKESTVSQNRSVAPSKINRHLPVECSTLTLSDVK